MTLNASIYNNTKVITRKIYNKQMEEVTPVDIWNAQHDKVAGTFTSRKD
jgi:hypothetical protein